MKLILASGSPRRKEILTEMGVDFDVLVTDADETTDERDPAKLVELLARRKAEAARAALPCSDGQIILAADTVVYADGQILGKPVDREDAARMIRLLSGSRHEVMTGVCVIREGKTVVTHDTTAVYFRALQEDEIQSYLDTGEPFGKAGAYAIQGLAGQFVEHVEGSFSNVVGLPKELVSRMLERI